MGNKRCIISFADNKGWYQNGQRRLAESCSKHFDGKFISINNYNTIGSPSHTDNPYAFKVYCIEYARSLGYTSILYIDSSLYPVKNCDKVFEYIESNGHLMQLAGHLVDTWCNDNCRAYFNLSHEESEGMVLYSAGFTGLDFNNPRSVEFFNQWKASCVAGAFKGAWTNTTKSESQNPKCAGHRHDMTAASIIANRLKMNFESFRWMAYVGSGYGDIPEESYFLCHPC